MPSLRERILNALLDLDLDAFKRFKWFLRDPEYVAGFQPLTKSALQGAAPEDVVDQIVQNFPGKECLIMATILQKVNRHDLALTFGDTPTVTPAVTPVTPVPSVTPAVTPVTPVTPAVTPAVSTVTPVTPVSPAQVSGPPVSPGNIKRTDLLQHSCQLYLDKNTANNHLELSLKNRKVTGKGRDQGRPKHKYRFTSTWQVLSREPLSDRCYFEVEWRGYVGVAVSYKDISREGGSSVFGHNKRSWGLSYSGSSYRFRHNSTNTDLSGRPSTVGFEPRGVLGVGVNQIKGSVSFYSVEDNTLTLLHTLKHTFTQPLYAGIWVDCGSTAEVCKIW